MFVHLVADFPADRNSHDHDLGVFTGPEGPAKVGAFFGDICDREVFDVAFEFKMFLGHVTPLFVTAGAARPRPFGFLWRWQLGCGLPWTSRLRVGRCASDASR